MDTGATRESAGSNPASSIQYIFFDFFLFLACIATTWASRGELVVTATQEISCSTQLIDRDPQLSWVEIGCFFPTSTVRITFAASERAGVISDTMAYTKAS